MVSPASLLQRIPSALWARRKAVGHKALSERSTRIDLTSGQASHHASPHGLSILFRSVFPAFLLTRRLSSTRSLSRVNHQDLTRSERSQAERRSGALLLDGFLRLRRSRINAVRAKRLTTAHHAPSQKVKVPRPFLLRSEGYTKAHGTAAVRNWNVKGEQKVLGLIWVWVYGARCSMTGYTSYQMQ
jgi:hypothetical protein